MSSDKDLILLQMNFFCLSRFKIFLETTAYSLVKFSFWWVKAITAERFTKFLVMIETTISVRISV